MSRELPHSPSMTNPRPGLPTPNNMEPNGDLKTCSESSMPRVTRELPHSPSMTNPRLGWPTPNNMEPNGDLKTCSESSMPRVTTDNETKVQCHPKLANSQFWEIQDSQLEKPIIIWQPEWAPTSSPWRMNDKWSENNFLSGSSSLANHGH
jgi:hypothetical protein